MLAPTIKRKDLRPCDVLCFEKNSGLGRSIQIMSRSSFNHTANLDYDLDVWEAIEPGYKCRSLDESIDEDTVYVVVKRPKYKINPGVYMQGIDNMKNAKYEFAGIFFQILRIFWGGWKGDKEVTKNTFCSKASSYLANLTGAIGHDCFYQNSPDFMVSDHLNYDTFILDLNDFPLYQNKK